MDKILNLHGLKSKSYIVLSKNLNTLLFAYWNFLKYEFEKPLTDSIPLLYDIVNILNLNDEIKNISFESDISYIGGYYSFEEKKLILNVKKLLQAKQLNIITNENFIIEYLTILFHEIFHAIQYQYMNNCKDYLISTMKQLSIYMKENKDLNIHLHDLIPDEREASIESAKLIYDFAQQNNLLSTKEQDETVANLLFYLTNGYLYRNRITIFPFQSISKFDEKIPILIDDNLDIYNKLIYGLDIQNNPTLALFNCEREKRLSKF